jgi:hypothetical protein
LGAVAQAQVGALGVSLVSDGKRCRVRSGVNLRQQE